MAPLRSCNVLFCKNKGSKGFHHLPSDQDIRLKWIKVCHISFPTKGTRVCHLHFCDKDYYGSSETKLKLKPTSIPSKNLPYERLNVNSSSDLSLGSSTVLVPVQENRVKTILISHQ